MVNQTTPLLTEQESFFLSIQKTLSESLPFMMNRMIEVIIDFAALAFMARLNESTLAATTLIGSYQVFVRGIPAVMLYYIPAIINQLYTDPGDEPKDKINILRSSYGVSFIMGMISFCLCYFSEAILVALKQDKQLSSIAARYLFIYGLGAPITFMYIASQFFIKAIHKPKKNVCHEISSNPIILIGLSKLSTLLIGLPLLNRDQGYLSGVSGMAFGQIMASLIGLLCYQLYFAYQGYTFFTWQFEHCKQILAQLCFKGGSISLYALGELGSILITTLFIGSMANSHIALAALLPALQISSLLSNATFAYSTGPEKLIRKCIPQGLEYTPGPKNMASAKLANRYANIGHVSCMALVLIFLIIQLTRPATFIDLFVKGDHKQYDEVYPLANELLLIFLGFQFADATRNQSTSNIRGVNGNTNVARNVVLLSMCVNITMSFILKYTTNTSPQSFVFIRQATIVIGSMVLWFNWRQGLFKAFDNEIEPDTVINTCGRYGFAAPPTVSRSAL